MGSFLPSFGPYKNSLRKYLTEVHSS